MTGRRKWVFKIVPGCLGRSANSDHPNSTLRTAVWRGSPGGAELGALAVVLKITLQARDRHKALSRSKSISELLAREQPLVSLHLPGH